ncbi:Ksr1 3-ketosphinganine reductase [Candida orthopsilosis Co 90-125]|uniref:3-ketodihydrosphingosine reductase TSC10 n=1 Tax=Candida orthopsilosis (strain 90-125) TaxID=1136231 RepID=H8XAM3_CANO9|nr:Ksr1 3-ketosphinganine reductase [Candida orthopsilosis Co 90-125]CCG24873.1 Ksr1 3-ketosphinganine reductase [Candida orthopsilosis Co 90-125]
MDQILEDNTFPPSLPHLSSHTMWFSKSNFPVDGKTAIIVGGSQGIGADIATKLYLQNCSVILVARTQSKLDHQVKTILNLPKTHPNHTARVSSYSCDASAYDDFVNLWKQITAHGYDPTIIFCCAGSSVPKLFNDLTSQDLDTGININYRTALNVIHSGFKHLLNINEATLPHDWPMRHIIIFSSVVSFFPFVGYAQYAPMKAALESLSVILRQELKPYNYRVSCVFPGNFQSEGFDEEQKTKPRLTKIIEGPSVPIPSDVCADMVFDQLAKGYDTITTDFIGWVLGCSTLGILPRQWGLFQVIVSFFLSVFAPVINWSIGREVKKHFKEEAKKID